jgi:indolepyruvate decarboxylase
MNMSLNRRNFLGTGIMAGVAPGLRSCFPTRDGFLAVNGGDATATDTQPTVAEYVVQRLAALGIKHAFGVPGDFAFPIDKAIEKYIDWVGCSNELNAAYSADGYARVNGAAILSTTYNVGSAAALAGVMGCKAERLPVFHLVGSPSTRLVRNRRHIHHSYADGNFDQFRQYHGVSVCTSAYLTPQNTISEMERVIFQAVSQRMPVYIEIPEDYALMPVVGTPVPGLPFAQAPTFLSDPTELAAALNVIRDRIEKASYTVILAAFTVARYGLQKELEALLDATKIQFVTTGMSKGLLSESNPHYLGMYNELLSPIVRDIVENAGLVLDLGGVAFCDGETNEFDNHLDSAKVITVRPDHVEIGSLAENGGRGQVTYSPIHMKDILQGLTQQPPIAKKRFPRPILALERLEKLEHLFTKRHIVPHLARYLHPDDILVTDTGTFDFLAMEIALPDRVQFQHALLWGSIGWGTAAAFGMALADPSKRVILVQGDGGHQCTANQIGVMGKYGVNPIILVLNNGIYGIEEVVMGNHNADKIQQFDRIAPWQYSMIPQAMGCSDWLHPTVRSLEDFCNAMTAARHHREVASYIEIIMDRDEILLPALSEKARDRLYQTSPPIV